MKKSLLILCLISLAFKANAFERVENWIYGKPTAKANAATAGSAVDTVEFWTAVGQALQKGNYPQNYINHAHSELQRVQTLRAHKGMAGLGAYHAKKARSSYTNKGYKSTTASRSKASSSALHKEYLKGQAHERRLLHNKAAGKKTVNHKKPASTHHKTEK